MSQNGRKPIRLVITKDCIANIKANREKWGSTPIAERGPILTRAEKFLELSKEPTKNKTELEKMRCYAAKRLRMEILRLTESDDFLIMTNTRQAYRDGGDYSMRVYPEPEVEGVSYFDLAMIMKEEATRRLSSDGFGDAYCTLLEQEGPDDEGNYEDL